MIKTSDFTVIKRPEDPANADFSPLKEVPGAWLSLPALPAPKTNEIASWLITRNNQVLGYLTLFRIDESTAAFGHFVCVDDPEAAGTLFSVAEDAARESGMKRIIGPMNGSTWEDYRWAVHWSDNPFLSETVHPDYYLALATGAGYSTESEYFTHLQTRLSYDQEMRKRCEALVRRAGVSFRDLNTAQLEKELELLYPFITRVFAQNRWYQAIDFPSFRDRYLKLRSVLSGDWVILAEDDSGIAGVMLSYPDLLNPERKRVILKTIARRPERKYAGVSHILSAMLIDRVKQNGLKEIIHAHMHRDNLSVNLSERFNGQLFREYKLLIKEL